MTSRRRQVGSHLYSLRPRTRSAEQSGRPTGEVKVSNVQQFDYELGNVCDRRGNSFALNLRTGYIPQTPDEDGPYFFVQVLGLPSAETSEGATESRIVHWRRLNGQISRDLGPGEELPEIVSSIERAQKDMYRWSFDEGQPSLDAADACKHLRAMLAAMGVSHRAMIDALAEGLPDRPRLGLAMLLELLLEHDDAANPDGPGKEELVPQEVLTLLQIVQVLGEHGASGSSAPVLTALTWRLLGMLGTAGSLRWVDGPTGRSVMKSVERFTEVGSLIAMFDAVGGYAAAQIPGDAGDKTLDAAEGLFTFALHAWMAKRFIDKVCSWIARFHDAEGTMEWSEQLLRQMAELRQRADQIEAWMDRALETPGPLQTFVADAGLKTAFLVRGLLSQQVIGPPTAPRSQLLAHGLTPFEPDELTLLPAWVKKIRVPRV